MKLLTFATPDDPRKPHLGILSNDVVVELAAAQAWAQAVRDLTFERLPDSLFEFISAGPEAWTVSREMIHILKDENPLELRGMESRPVGRRLSETILYPPLPRPMSLRDFYAFEQHVAAANSIRSREIPPEWYQFPVFYFSNPNAIFGPGETIPCPPYTRALDFELEVACVISKPGINIPAEQAEEYIFGFTIFNDWSARDIQKQETRVGLGPAKAKDFASSLGPWIVTPEELADRSTGRPGVYDLEMTARVNGVERSRGNWKEIYYSFGEMIARASAGAYLFPGDVIGSGTVGSGCLLEQTLGKGPWLSPGDLVELRVERLGVLANRVGAGPV